MAAGRTRQEPRTERPDATLDRPAPWVGRHVPAPPPEDDRALARMLALAFLAGLGIWVALGLYVLL
ncbi:hypothetical protein [Rubellimicrobium arenae]|uniref:hypothetical protein n=1 Tax=Rubellimicrobium arenae TaxID=2817372 RepID=UPI001B30C975|nr:hypothetical protein [Rubellimicrobium arenae]